MNWTVVLGFVAIEGLIVAVLFGPGPIRKWRPRIIAASAAVAVALLGGLAWPSTSTSLGPPPTTTSTTPSSTAPPTTSSSTTAEPTTTRPILPRVRRKGELTLTYLHGADLDTTDLNWDVGYYDAQGEIGKLDVVLSNGLSGSAVSSAELASVSGPAILATCQSATAYSSDLGGATFHTGAEVCVRTTDQRFALLQVVAVYASAGDTNSSITMNVTVWDPPNS